MITTRHRKVWIETRRKRVQTNPQRDLGRKKWEKDGRMSLQSNGEGAQHYCSQVSLRERKEGRKSGLRLRVEGRKVAIPPPPRKESITREESS